MDKSECDISKPFFPSREVKKDDKCHACEAKDKRIADVKGERDRQYNQSRAFIAHIVVVEADNERLRATCKDREAEIKSLSGHLEAAIDRNERLRAVYETAKAYSKHRDSIRADLLDDALAAAKEDDDG